MPGSKTSETNDGLLACQGRRFAVASLLAAQGRLATARRWKATRTRSTGVRPTSGLSRNHGVLAVNAAASGSAEALKPNRAPLGANSGLIRSGANVMQPGHGPLPPIAAKPGIAA